MRATTMNRYGIALAVALALSGSAHAAAVEGQRLALTIYNQDLALVEDVRPLDFTAGRSRLEFKDVSAEIRPETVALSAAGVAIVEQNFDFDLLTPEKMMEKAVGHQVRIVRTNPGNGNEVTETATVLSVNNGVVLKIGDRIEVLRADGAPTRVIFDKVPENLRARPTLSVNVESSAAGRRDATLSYLTTGLSWKADYVALFDEQAKKLDMQGWVTLTNKSGTTFSDAVTQLVAGNINIVRSEQPEWQQQQLQQEQQRIRAARQTGNEAGVRRPLADYYVYPLPERTTVADNQTKQVGFLDAQGVAARKVYEYSADWFASMSDPEHAAVVVRFANSSKGGLGAQLPAGMVRVYVRDTDGKPRFVGENRIGHIPQGSEISVKTGDAFDVTVQRTLVKQDRAGFWRSRYSMEYLVRNARSESVTLDIRQGGLWREGKVLQESIKSTRPDAYTLQWSVPVAANGETKLTFTVETGW
ncbi:MAG TPA: DUF4139 domain-containing protein [Steroidobacteraceae bacterium]|nr:DUF4139 domain-containing protein [Steroidobacteraceae bacterium]